MLLLIDAGNTNVKFGVSQGDELVARWRVSTNRTSMPDEWWVIINTLAAADKVELNSLDGAVLSSSVPAVTPWLSQMIRDRIGLDPIVVDAMTNMGIQVDIDNPLEVGPDRLVDAAAAFARFGGPTIVLDFGTATTLNVVTRDGRFIGGAIAPDIRAAHDALVGRAARLTSVELVMPANAIGRNTVASMQSGIMFGYLGLVEGLIRRIDAEVGETTTVVATGGFGRLFAEHCPRISIYLPDLTIDGLRLIWERARPT
ncbi:MAG TPA: type III pantothenate kinase [Thermomicrobiales bacterium]|nr:type III pantothenate kinase [Thermomicrobiales bacterium]